MLKVNNLRIMSGTKVLVDDVCFELKSGESLALMGISGSGKSLTAMACVGLLPPNVKMTSGTIDYGEGQKKPALIMQNPADCFDPLFTMRSVFKHSFGSGSFFSTSSAEQDTFTQKILRKVGFTNPQDILLRYPFELSGGMLHRIMIALALGRVLLGKASCIIADEPLSGLDRVGKVQILRLIKELQQEYALSLLYIDHDLHASKAIAKALAIIHEGRIIEQKNFNDIRESIVHTQTEKLFAAHERLEQNSPSIHSFSDKSSPLLTVKDLTKSYAGKMVLKQINFNLYAGQSLGLVGINGAGKSTLLRLLLGLEQADAGQITCIGHLVENTYNETSWRKNIQAVFQHARLAVNPRFSVAKVLSEPLKAQGLWQKMSKGQRETELEELLSLVDLPLAFINKYPIHMSGGQLQRLCLARALTLRPKILLLDEPLADLDVIVAEHMQKMLINLQNKLKLTFLYISHDLRSMIRLCSTLMVLDNGIIVDKFPSQDFQSSKRHDVFQNLFQADFGSL